MTLGYPTSDMIFNLKRQRLVSQSAKHTERDKWQVWVCTSVECLLSRFPSKY